MHNRVDKEGPEKENALDENALLMSEVRGEWADWLEMIERQQ